MVSSHSTRTISRTVYPYMEEGTIFVGTVDNSVITVHNVM